MLGEIIPERLQRAALFAGYKSMYAAAKAAELQPGVYHALMHQRTKKGGTVLTLCKLCEAFGCSADFLLGMSDEL